MSSAYLRLLIFLPAILISACASFSLAFCMMQSACKLNKQGDNIQSWCTPFPIWNQSVVPCPVLTVASWPAYRFLKRQVRWSDIPISWRIFQSLFWSSEPQGWKRSVFIPISKKSNAKGCSNYHTIALISHASKVMLKVLQARHQLASRYSSWI